MSTPLRDRREPSQDRVEHQRRLDNLRARVVDLREQLAWREKINLAYLTGGWANVRELSAASRDHLAEIMRVMGDTRPFPIFGLQRLREQIRQGEAKIVVMEEGL